jgi:hypothetical protein
MHHVGGLGILVLSGHDIGPHGIADAIAFELGARASATSEIGEWVVE